jgi:hypothetical protein
MFIAFARVISVLCLKSKEPILSSGPFAIERKHMDKPAIKTTLAGILQQRATLAKVRAETEDLDDYLAAIEARARDTGERISMAVVHRRRRYDA